MIGLGSENFHARSREDMSALGKTITRLQSQVATGQRIERASEDPAAAARLRSIARTEKLAQVDTANVTRARTDLTLADDALQRIALIVLEARDVAVRAGGAGLSDKDRGHLATEVEGLRENLLALANTRDADDAALFGGGAPGPAYAESGVDATYAGIADAREIEVAPGETIATAPPGPALFNLAGADGPTDLFAVLGNLAFGLRTGGDAAAEATQTALANLDTGLGVVTTQQAAIGSRLATLDLTSERAADTAIARAQERSAIGDTDLAETIARLQQTMTVLEASQASFVRLSDLSLFKLLR